MEQIGTVKWEPNVMRLTQRLTASIKAMYPICFDA